MDRLVGCATLVKESAEEAMVQRLWGIWQQADHKDNVAACTRTGRHRIAQSTT